MANVEAWGSRPAGGLPPDEGYVEHLFRGRYLEMVRLAGLLGADDPEDIAQEAFTRLMNKEPDLGDARAWRVCAASSARACSSSSRSVRPSSAEAISAAPSFRALGLDAGAQAPSGAQVSLAGTGRAAIRALRDQAVLASCSFQTPGSWTVPRLVVTVAGSGNVPGRRRLLMRCTMARGRVSRRDQGPRLPVGAYGYDVLFPGMPSLRLRSEQDERRVSSSPGNARQ